MARVSLSIDDFILERPVGRGGMGEVWRGRHRHSLMPVAIKLLSENSAKSQVYHHAFRREMRAAASLDHPNIVKVYDYGTVDGDAAANSMGRFSAGSPYLVMELIEDGSIGHYRGRLAWPQLRQLLSELLSALAHAHARGIVHRDIKFGNVLIGETGLKLADFGLAHAMLEEDMGDAPSGGTPTYMAPEQFQRNVREFGPWTDLYAVGCLAWILVSGKPPFREKGWVAKMHAHLTKSPPALVSRVSLPNEFEHWLRTLMRKDPRLRFRRAADAAHALNQLGEPSIGKRRQRRVMETVDDEELTLVSGGEVVTDATPVVVEPRRNNPRDWGKPWIPSDWRTEFSVEPYGLFSAGLGVFGFRAIPIVGREAERDQLWAELKTVCTRHQARVVTIAGTAGTGKSFLAEWLCRYGHEVGSAIILRTSHQPVPGSNNGLSRLLASHYSCNDLYGTALVDYLEQRLIGEGEVKEWEWMALAELIAPTPDSDFRFESTTERYALSQRCLARISSERPLIVFADDVHWGLESIEFASHVLRYHPDTPVLFVFALTDSMILDRPAELEALAELNSLSGVTEIALDGLDPSSMSMLIRDMLQLRGDLPDRLQQHVGGNPRYAVQLVSHLVRQGVLIPSERGLGLREGVQLELPSDEYASWRVQLERGLRDLPEEARRVLELGAALGTEIQREEWALSCEYSGLVFSEDLIEALGASYLVREDEGVWHLSHRMLAHVIEEEARESGRWRMHHACCAKAIRSCYPQGITGLSGRLGRHLVEAGKLESAVTLLAKGAIERMDESDFRGAHAFLDYRDRALDDLGLSSNDERRIKGLLIRTQLLRNQGYMDKALDLLTRVGLLFGEDEDLLLRATHAYELARLHLVSESLDESERCFEEAKELFQTLSEHRKMADCKLGLGEVYTLRGSYEKALEYMEEARDKFRSLGASVDEAWAMRMISRVYLRRGELVEAEQVMRVAMRTFEHYNQIRQIAHCRRQIGIIYTALGRYEEALAWHQRALALFDRAGDPLGRQSCLNGFAEVARFQGRLQDAERGYRAALTISRQSGTHDWTIPKVNLGLVLLMQDKTTDAYELLQEVHGVLVQNHRLDIQGGVEMALAICELSEGLLGAALQNFDSACAKIRETGILDADIAGTTEMLGDKAKSVNQLDLARRSWELAASHWSALGDNARVAGVTLKLASLA